MSKKSFFIGVACLLSGHLLPVALADNSQQNPHQFPPATPVAGAQTTPAAAPAPTQFMPQQPMYYGYPVNMANRAYPGMAPTYYYPQGRTAQPMAVMPYAYPQNYTNIPRGYPGMMQRPAGQGQMQAPQIAAANQAPQYRSPYNPNIAATPGPKPPPPPQPKKEIKPWGDTRYIWPDFYTDFTGDFWDEMINAPYQMGYMPGGWRFPSLSSPDPVTVGDAVANQVPPILDESANFVNFAD